MRLLIVCFFILSCSEPCDYFTYSIIHNISSEIKMLLLNMSHKTLELWTWQGHRRAPVVILDSYEKTKAKGPAMM